MFIWLLKPAQRPTLSAMRTAHTPTDCPQTLDAETVRLRRGPALLVHDVPQSRDGEMMAVASK